MNAVALEYLERATRLCPSAAERFDSEDLLLSWAKRHLDRQAGRLILLDAGGEMISSEEFARYLGLLKDGGVQRVMFCVGPAEGWSQVVRVQADRMISLGPMTLPHELARVVLAEQVYRALTILAGHPYHLGH